ncbi:MAG: transglutaminase family protein [Bacteroidetes bacterium]|nr:transglutaminase family protein [Bacteroidota bacterium]
MRRSSLFLTVVLLMSAGGTDLSAQDVLQVMRSGSQCGTMRIDLQRLSNDYLQYEIREERRFIGIDDREETWLRTLRILVDSSFHIISLSGRQISGGEEIEIQGSCARGTLYLTWRFSDGRIESRREDCNAPPDVALPELVHQDEHAFPTRIFFIDDLRSRSVSVTSEPTLDGGMQITIAGESEFHLTRDGALRAWRMPATTISREAAGTQVAGIEPCDIDAGVYWDAGQVGFSAAAENIRELDVRLTLTREVGARLVPEDKRQQIARDVASDAASVQLQIAKTRYRLGTAMLPIRDPDLFAYLEESPLLTVTAEDVRYRAVLLRSMDRNISNIVEAVLGWISNHFVIDDFIPVVSADRLVRSPRGTTLHAAMLFVTLTRAAGVPSRLVLGLRPEQGRWRSAVWAEVWTGDWLSVDPIKGGYLDDAVHVKLLHALTVDDLREQAGRLQGAVKLDLLALKEIDTGESGKLHTGIFDGTYVDRVFRVRFNAPEGWLIESSEKQGIQTDVIISREAGSDVRFEIQLTMNPYILATREVYNAKVRALGVVLTDVEVIDKGEIRFGNRKVPYVLYSYQDTRRDADQRRITTADCIFTIGHRGYLVRFTAPSDVFRDYDMVLQQFLREVELYED